ncbi:MAG: VOC family protein [Thermomicrobiales bacterium]
MAASLRRYRGDGLFVWYDLMAVDEAATSPFYSGLFGWEFSAEARPPDGYRTVTLDGRGLGGCLPYQTESGRSAWMGYIQVTGIEDRMERARDLGANFYVELMEIPGIGKLSVLDDPTGASFYLYQPSSELWTTESAYDRGPGHVIWNELITNDLEAASAFYREIAGWELVPMGDGPNPYTVAKADGAPVAGLFQPGESPERSAWIMSVETSDIDATIAHAVELGGRIIHPANTVPGVGRTAWIADPTGGVVGLMQPESGWLDRL